MKLRNWISAGIGFLILVTCIGYASSPKKVITLDSAWTTLDNKRVDLYGLLKKQEKIYILYFGATDCGACVEKGIQQIKQYTPNPLFMMGYVLDSEITFATKMYENISILKDSGKALFLRMKLRQLTPIILKINQKREIEEYINVDLSSSPK